MTNEADKILTYLRARDLPVTRKAADLIEQLQRERDEARDRLAEVERERDANNKFARKHHSEGFFEGFRAAIESAAEKARIHMLGMSKERSDKMQKAILALTPSDNPSAPSVAEAARVLLDWAAKEYIVDSCVPQENREPGCASCDLLNAFEIIADGLADYKTDDTELHRRICALAAQKEGE